MKKEYGVYDEYGQMEYICKRSNPNYKILLDKNEAERYKRDVYAYVNRDEDYGANVSKEEPNILDYSYDDVDMSYIVYVEDGKLYIDKCFEYYDDIFDYEDVDFESYENIVDKNDYFNVEEVLDLTKNIKRDDVGIVPNPKYENLYWFMDDAINKRDYTFLYKEEYYRFLESAKKDNNQLYYDSKENDLTKLGYNELNKKIEYLKQLGEEYCEKYGPYKIEGDWNFIIPIWECEDLIIKNVCYWILHDSNLHSIKEKLLLKTKLESSCYDFKHDINLDLDAIKNIFDEIIYDENISITMGGQTQKTDLYNVIYILINKAYDKIREKPYMNEKEFLQKVFPQIDEYLQALKNDVQRLNKIENKTTEINDRIELLNSVIENIMNDSKECLKDQIEYVDDIIKTYNHEKVRSTRSYDYPIYGTRPIGLIKSVDDWVDFNEEREYPTIERIMGSIFYEVSNQFGKTRIISDKYTEEEVKQIKESNCWKNRLSFGVQKNIASKLGFPVIDNFEFNEIDKTINKIVKTIKEGINLPNGKHRDFDLLDYYKIINIPLNKLETILEKNIHKQENYLENDLLLMQFISQNNCDCLNEKSIEKIYSDKHIVGVQFDKKNRPIPGTGREITKEEKQNIIFYLNENKIPLNIKTYSIAMRRYLNGELLINQNNLENDINISIK